MTFSKNNTAYFYYDGKCPFCASYSQFIRIRAIIKLELIDARLHPEKIQELKMRGHDITEGMILDYQSQIYTGAQALQKLNTLTRLKNSYFHSLFRQLQKSTTLTKLLYRCIQKARKTLLWILRREEIGKS